MRAPYIPRILHHITKSTAMGADDADEPQSSSSIPQTLLPAMAMVMTPSMSSRLLLLIELSISVAALGPRTGCVSDVHGIGTFYSFHVR